VFTSDSRSLEAWMADSVHALAAFVIVIGDHVCLIDRDYRIHDVLHFEMNFETHACK
jgi:hypothetical protein